MLNPTYTKLLETIRESVNAIADNSLSEFEVIAIDAHTSPMARYYEVERAREQATRVIAFVDASRPRRKPN